jgi:ABC-type Zn uptake system ZnuABC Zn-binding protein ZnuA
MVTRIVFSKLVRMRLAILLLFAAACLPGIAACGGEDAAGEGTGPTVVATTTQAADLVRNVAGERAGVQGLLAPNTDPHDYEVRPGDVKALAQADLVVRSGGEADEWLDAAIESSGADAPVLTLIDRVQRRGDDPHWWQDPRNAERAVAAIGEALADVDPGGRSAYEERAAAYTERIRALDAAVQRCIQRIPPAQRKLVTTHDALGYYADRYGIEVIGTVIPSLSTQAQPSAGDIAELTDTIRRERVRAIFAESSVNPKVEQAIAKETGARVGEALWADSLGSPGSSGATYLDSIRANTEAIVDGLTGGERTCTLPR